jgi:two-component system response regulator YesN
MDNGKAAFVVFIMFVKKLYHGREDLARAKEYLDSHWQGEYDAETAAKSVGMSVAQLYKIFKHHTGMTPGGYHKRCKIERIKEKLADKNISIKEAFAACGEDSRGRIAKVFKELTGLSPAQWRRQNNH